MQPFLFYRITKIWFRWIMLYLTIAGMITFSLFILEEDYQTTMIGTWPAQDAGRWDIVKVGTDTMSGITLTMKIVNYSVGWFQPLAFVSYRAYAKSADYYTTSLRAKAIHNAPELFEGEKIDIIFTMKQISTVANGYLIRSGRYGVIRKQRPQSRSFPVTGTLTLVNNQIIIKEDREDKRHENQNRRKNTNPQF